MTASESTHQSSQPTKREHQQSYTHSLMALLAEHAKRGVNSCPVILDTLLSVPDDAVDAGQYHVWVKMRDLAADGKPPTILALKRELPNVSAQYWIDFRSEEGSIKDVRDAMLTEASFRAYVGFYKELGQMLRERVPFSTINAEMQRLMDEALASGPEATALDSFSYMDRIMALRAGTVPLIKTPWPELNKILGGGLFCGGDSAMTAILAYSGVGKTRFFQQINKQAGEDGHWTVVFAGESNALTYKLSMGQMLGYVEKAHMSPDTMTDKDVRLLREIEKEVNGMHTWVYDLVFNPNVIRAVMSRIARQLKAAKTAGEAPPHAQLLVGIDNIDHAIQGGSEKEWQELEQAAKGIYQTAQRLEAHVIPLAQAKLRGFHEGHPPGTADFARANIMASHFPNIIGLYRPVTYEQRNASPSDTRSQAKVSVAKTRSGSADTYYPSVENMTGTWL